MPRGHRGPEIPEPPGDQPSRSTGAALLEGGLRLFLARRPGEGEEQGAWVKLSEPCVRDPRVRLEVEVAKVGCWKGR